MPEEAATEVEQAPEQTAAGHTEEAVQDSEKDLAHEDTEPKQQP
jgi:hypothetical protein